MSETIVALSTPFGRSGIGVIRLSGEKSLAITRKLVRDENFSPAPRSAILKKLYDSEGTQIDSALVTFFQSPQSFTGENVVELSCHGSPVLLRQVIDSALKNGARLAEAGEFTLRALANGQLNLSQAEAIRDLIDAQTTSAVRQANRQLRGELSAQLQPLKDDLLNIIVVLESALEFVEDDLPAVAIENIKVKLNKIQAECEKLAATFRAGRLIREGLKVALVGKPNVGKSSLFNALLGENRAIVTEIAGTTRDSLRENLSIKGIPIALIDTAGLRETSDTVEKIGVEKTEQAIADADLIIVVLDGASDLTREDFEILAQVKETNFIVALNKSDIAESKVQSPKSKVRIGVSDFQVSNSSIVNTSAKTGAGLEALKAAIIAPFSAEDIENSGFLISDARHFDLLNRANFEIENSLALLKAKMSEEIILVGLHNALKLLGEITGETTSEDVLTRIFATFCIGK